MESAQHRFDTHPLFLWCALFPLQRLKELQAETPDKPVLLRVEVEGGGCSGFQYKFRLDHSKAQDDL